MERIVDYLAEELKREEEKKAGRKAKHARMAKLITDIQAKAAGVGR